MVSTLPDPATGFAIPPADVPVSPELTEVRTLVRRLETQLAAEHGLDNPVYWRAMSERLQDALDDSSRPEERSERARRWLARVAGAYRALAASELKS